VYIYTEAKLGAIITESACIWSWTDQESRDLMSLSSAAKWGLWQKSAYMFGSGRH